MQGQQLVRAGEVMVEAVGIGERLRVEQDDGVQVGCLIVDADAREVELDELMAGNLAAAECGLR